MPFTITITLGHSHFYIPRYEVGGEIISRPDPQRKIDIASGMIEIISCVVNGNQKAISTLIFPIQIASGPNTHRSSILSQAAWALVFLVSDIFRSLNVWHLFIPLGKPLESLPVGSIGMVKLLDDSRRRER